MNLRTFICDCYWVGGRPNVYMIPPCLNVTFACFCSFPFGSGRKEVRHHEVHGKPCDVWIFLDLVGMNEKTTLEILQESVD